MPIGTNPRVENGLLFCMLHLFRSVFNVSSKLIDVFHRVRWIWSGALQCYFIIFDLFFTAFLDAQNRSIYLFRFAPWRVEAKLKPSPLSSAWIALKYRSRSGLWPWSLREPRTWCAFQMHFGSQMMVLVLDWACHCSERSKMSTMTWRFRRGPQGFPANSPHLVQSCSRLWAEVASECHQKGMDQMCTGFLLAHLGPLACLIVNFVDLVWWHRCNIVVQKVVSCGVFVKDRFPRPSPGRHSLCNKFMSVLSRIILPSMCQLLFAARNPIRRVLFSTLW